MGQGLEGRATALLAMILIGFSPAFGQDRQAGGEPLATEGFLDGAIDEAVLDSGVMCPTRFDYVILASFADAPNMLSLSTYRFRSQTGFSGIPLTGFQRVAYRADAPAPDPACRPRVLSSREQAG